MFEEARIFVRRLGLKTSKEWEDYKKNHFPHLPQKPENIPNKPNHVYRDKGWISMSDWHGGGKFKED